MLSLASLTIFGVYFYIDDSSSDGSGSTMGFGTLVRYHIDCLVFYHSNTMSLYSNKRREHPQYKESEITVLITK